MAEILTTLTIKNFRCFDDHTIEFQPKSLIVGKNNAGKSTCIEALRMVSLVTDRMRSLTFRPPPRGLELPKRAVGLSPSLDSIMIHKEGVFNRYGDPPASVTATFSNKSRIEVHFGEGLLLHAVIYGADGQIIKNRRDIDIAAIPLVSILPQISPLAEEEAVLDDAYVRSQLQTSRCSLHFRNQLRIFSDLFPHFSQLVSSTWPGLRIAPPDVPGWMDTGKRISFIIRDRDFAAEIACMGHGLQMWLQTAWFLTRNQNASTLILDEPDVYLHADLQRKLVRMLLADSRQFIIATHSPEMLAEVEPDSVIVLNRSRRASRSATSSGVVQELLNHIGSVHNISLSKLAAYGRILLVEGKDIPILKLFQNASDPNAAMPVDAIPNCEIGGWSKWPAVVMMANFFRRNTPDQIDIFCLLDRDYHTDAEIAGRLDEARRHNIHLHIWARKELENYALEPNTIARLIAKDSGKNVTTEDVSRAINAGCEAMRDEATDSISNEIRLADKKMDPNKSNPIARAIVKERWKREGGPSVVCGKELFSKVAKWSQDEYGVILSPQKLIRAMAAHEVPREIVDYISQVTKPPEGV